MKVFSITLRVLAIISAGVALLGWIKTNGKLADKREQLQANRAEMERLQQQFSSARDDAVRYSSQVRAKDSVLAGIRAEAEHLRVQCNKLRSDLVEKEQRLDDKSEALADRQMEITTLKDELIACNTAPVGPSVTIEQYESQIAALKKELDDLKNAAVKTEEPTVVPTLNKGDAAQGIATHIVSIRPEEGLLILAAGEERGLAKKAAHLQLNGLNEIQVKIAAIYPSYSLAHILPGQEDVPSIKKGATVILTQ